MRNAHELFGKLLYKVMDGGTPLTLLGKFVSPISPIAGGRQGSMLLSSHLGYGVGYLKLGKFLGKWDGETG